MQKLDRLDLRILEVLQADASVSLSALADRVHLSSNACWRRVKRLEESGVVRGRVALLDAAKLGLGLTVFVGVRAGEHSQDWYERFARAVQAIPEVVEFYRMSGELDYLLKVLAADMAAYDEVYKRLISIGRLKDVSGAFAMEVIKHTTGVPLTAVRT